MFWKLTWITQSTTKFAKSVSDGDVWGIVESITKTKKKINNLIPSLQRLVGYLE